MEKNFPVADSHIQNSFEMVKKLKDIEIEDNHKLISLDVVSLFTNIPIDLAI